MRSGFCLQKVKYIVFCMPIFILLCIFLIFDWQSDRLPIYNGTIEKQATNWYFAEEGEPLQPIDFSVAQKQEMKPNKTYILSKILEDTSDADWYPGAMFIMNHYGIKVYLDGVLMFQHTKQDLKFPTNNSLGLLCFSVPIGTDYQGKELRLELDPMLDTPTQRYLPEVYFGDYPTMVHRLYMENLPYTILANAIIFLAIILFAVGGVHAQIREKCLNLVIFAVVLVLYCLTENLFVVHMIASPYLMYVCHYFCLAIVPIFPILAYKNKFSPSSQKIFWVFIFAAITNCTIQMFLHFFGIKDVQKMFRFSHLCCMIPVITTFLLLIRERKNPEIQHVCLETMPFLCGVVLDFIMYHKFYQNSPQWHVTSLYSSFGILITLMIVIYEIRKATEQIQKESLQSEVFKEMAYKDALTGLPNRAAFEKEIQEIVTHKKSNTNTLVLSIDLNGLKKVNDTMGHQAGDNLIKRGADILQSCLSQYGCVFRIGGDEFYAFLYNVDELEWETIKDYFQQELKRMNKNEKIPLSISIGCAVVHKKYIQQCIQLADERMYEEKRSAPDRRI